MVLKLMRIVYSDEAGVGDGAVEPITVVAAIVVHADSQAEPIEHAVDQILLDLIPPEERETFEFKANKLFARRDKGNNEQRLRRLLGLIDTFELPIAHGAAHRVNVKQDRLEKQIPWDEHIPQNIAFMLAATGVETLMREWHPSEKALWIADETRARVLMKPSLKTYQQRALLPTEKATQFSHIMDTVYFGDSKESRFIQLADVCSFFLKQHHMSNISAEPYYQLIKEYLIGGERLPVGST